MLSSEEMFALKQDETYRATLSWKYNWKHAKRALELGFHKLAPSSNQKEDETSLSLDDPDSTLESAQKEDPITQLPRKENPTVLSPQKEEDPTWHSLRDNGRCFATGFQRAFWPISKRRIIAEEIGRFRNEVIENVFTSGVCNLDFEQIISQGYIWMEINTEKLKFIRNITILFLADIQVSAQFYHYSHISDEEYKKKTRDIEDQYTARIKALKDASKKCNGDDKPVDKVYEEKFKEMKNSMTGDLTE